MLRTVLQKLSQFLSFCARNLIKLDVQVSSKKRQGLHVNKDKALVCLREKLSFVGKRRTSKPSWFYPWLHVILVVMVFGKKFDHRI